MGINYWGSGGSSKSSSWGLLWAIGRLTTWWAYPASVSFCLEPPVSINITRISKVAKEVGPLLTHLALKLRIGWQVLWQLAFFRPLTLLPGLLHLPGFSSNPSSHLPHQAQQNGCQGIWLNSVFQNTVNMGAVSLHPTASPPSKGIFPSQTIERTQFKNDKSISIVFDQSV